MASGSKLVLPMVVLNMGGEMVNILHQRLGAQHVEEAKGKAVLRDVISTMLSPKFIDELFKQQDMYSDKATRDIFFKLAHSSIMRLNESSMDKLLDLITMGFKYQALSCTQPQQLLQITLNHLEVLKRMLPSVSMLVDSVIKTTIAAYRHLDIYGWIELKHGLFEFFQGRQVKISLFLQYRVQLSNGMLVLNTQGLLPVGTEFPGLIRYLGPDGAEENVISLPMTSAEGIHGSMTSYIDFDNPMGTNFYEPSPKSALDPGVVGIRTSAAEAAAEAVSEAARWKPEAARSKLSMSNEFGRDVKEESKAIATAGLNLLASLLGASSEGDIDIDDGDDAGASGAKRRCRRDSFKINLFPNDPFDAAQAKDCDEVKTITIDLASSHTGCAKMLQDLNLSDDADDGGDVVIRKSSKAVDKRASGSGFGGRAEAKNIEEEERERGSGQDDDAFDDLLDLMDSTAESK